ncbi:MAG: hypothetical protein JSS14_28485 [Proteobacteria bacterium]|nr:hypothetical protein [Pseudomonadota bacterium]
MISRILGALLLASLLSACTGYRPPPGYTVCATQPGSWECQVEQYEKVDH